MKNLKIMIIFFIALNGALITLAMAAWIYPAASEFTRLRALLHMQESRLRIKEENISQYEQNIHILADMAQHDMLLRTIVYERLADTLALISTTAEKHSLTELEFYTTEPIIQEHHHHIRVSMRYNGDYDDLCRFIAALAALPCYIDRLTLVPLEDILWVHLSIYAEIETD